MTCSDQRHADRSVGGRSLRWLAVTVACIVATAGVAHAQGTTSTAQEPKPTIEVYGFGQADAIVDFKTNNPQWFDVMRPTKLPAFDNEFGEDGRFYSGVRQSRLGVKAWAPTKLGELYTIFEFELFGTGVDAGQTTFRLRHA